MFAYKTIGKPSKIETRKRFEPDFGPETSHVLAKQSFRGTTTAVAMLLTVLLWHLFHFRLL